MTDNSLDTIGGAEESTKIIINGIQDEFNLGVIQPGNIMNPKSGIHYYPVTLQTRLKHLIKTPFLFMRYIWKVKKVIIREKPKIIHTQAQVSFFIVALLRKLKLISSDFQLVHTERGLYINYSVFFKRLFLFFMKELDVLITTTEYNMNYWKKALRNRKRQLLYRVIENTAGDIFETYDKTQEKNEDNLVIGFAGRYSKQKNWAMAVEICEGLNKNFDNNIKIIMAVGCLDTKSKLLTQKMFRRLEDCLGRKFVGKININMKEMNEFYYQTDIFIMTSKPNSESFGRTLVEAMSRKTVVLTTDAGGPTEVIKSKDNICNTANQFIDKITELNSNKLLMNHEKAKNLLRVKRKYSLQNNIAKHFSVYKELI